MKKTKIFNCLVLSILALSFAKAQNISFEDANFKALLLSASPSNGIARDASGYAVAIDTNNDGEISYEEVLNVYRLGSFDSPFMADIVSMKEIQYFTNLTSLSGVLPSLESLDLSKNINLQTMEVDNTQIETLDLSKNINLKNLSLRGNPNLKTIDISENVNLTGLDLSIVNSINSGIETLDVSKNINLTSLNLTGCTKIGTLDVSKNINLQYLFLDNTNIETLDVSKNISLQNLELGYNNKIETLDVSKNINLSWLYLGSSSMIKTIDVSKNINLQMLDLDNTGIETLDVSKNINLQSLILDNTSIETLDVSSNLNLVGLYIQGCTALTSLYMKNGVSKTFDNNYNFQGTDLKSICCDEDEIATVKDYMQNLATNDLLAAGWQASDLVVGANCENLGTEDLSLQQAKATLYPNPVKDVLYFSTSGKVAKAEIYDLNGRLIKTSAVSSNSVNVSDLANGLYFIVLETDKGVVKEKFIKN